MKIKFYICIEEEFPRDGRVAIMEVDALINDTEYCTRERIPKDADPVYFDYIWEKIGKQIKDEYMKSLK